MLIEIKNRYTGGVLYSGEFASVRLCLQSAVKSGSDLRGSDLSGSNLRNSDLSGSDLRGSDLRNSDLRGSDLRGSDLRGSDLSGSDLRGTILDGLISTPAQAIANLDVVREIILDDPAKRLYMGHWHADNEWIDRSCAQEAICGTTHCLAGWLQVCSVNPDIRKLSASTAGYLLAPIAAPMFLSSNERVLQWLTDREYAA